MHWTIRQRVFLLIVLLTIVCSAIAGGAIVVLYHTALDTERTRLTTMVRTQARLMDAIARFDERYSAHDHPQGAAGATLSQILDAHRRNTGFGQTGELTLARMERDAIVWLLPRRHDDPGHSDAATAANGPLAQPMRLALSGQSGTIIGLDYRGETVLAAYEPVSRLGLGVVAKIDVQELRAPFIHAGVATGVVGLAIIGLSGLLLFRVSHPVIERLEESEAYTRAVIAHAADGIITADETGTIHTFNTMAERIFLFSAPEVIGKNLSLLMPAPDNEAHQHHLESYLKTGQSRILGTRREVTARRRDGTTIPITLAVTEVTLSTRRLFIAIVRDLTEEKRAERCLVAQYAVARILAESTTVGEATPAILRAVCTSLGWQLGALWQVDRDVLRCLEVWCQTPAHYPEFIAATKKTTFAKGQGLPGRVWDSERPCWIPDVVMDANFPRASMAARENLHAAFAFPIQLQGRIYGVMEFFSFHIHEPDEALLQQMQAVGTQIGQMIERLKIQKDMEILAKFPEENPQAVLRIARNGKVLYRNNPGTALLAALERNPVHASQWREAVDRAFREGGTHQQDLNAQDQIFDVTFTVIEGTDYLNVYAQEVTEQRNTETALRLHEEQLRQAQKLEAIGTLAGGIAHDFNNILTALIGFTELAIAKTPATAPIAAHLREIMKANYRAKELIHQILTFSRHHEGGKKPVHLQPIVEEALKLLRATFPSTIAIHKDLQPTAGPVLADPTQIHQVVMNLATNAEHAMRGQTGTLDVSLAEVTIDAATAAHLPGPSPGRYVRLIIADSGCGIPPDLLSRIFDPFFTTKNVGEGTGMGLSVTHGIVTDHGGTITVSSEVGKGTTFVLHFPVTAETPRDEPDAAHTLPRGAGLVFFIDDEPAIAESGAAMLEELGYRVRAFTDSREALEAFHWKADEVAAVVTDHTMPECTGEQLAQAFLRLRPSLPIVLCTGFSHTMDEAKALAIGIRVFLRKPYLFHELAHAVHRALTTAGHS